MARLKGFSLAATATRLLLNAAERALMSSNGRTLALAAAPTAAGPLVSSRRRQGGRRYRAAGKWDAYADRLGECPTSAWMTLNRPVLDKRVDGFARN